MVNNKSSENTVHILVEFLIAIAGVIWAWYRLHNSGVNLNSFNSSYWARITQVLAATEKSRIQVKCTTGFGNDLEIH